MHPWGDGLWIGTESEDDGYDSLPERNDILRWCERRGLLHVETCAHDGTGVIEAFALITELALDSTARNPSREQTQRPYELENKNAHDTKEFDNEETLIHIGRDGNFIESANGRGTTSMMDTYTPTNKKLDLFSRYEDKKKGCFGGLFPVHVFQ